MLQLRPVPNSKRNSCLFCPAPGVKKRHIPFSAALQPAGNDHGTYRLFHYYNLVVLYCHQLCGYMSRRICLDALPFGFDPFALVLLTKTISHGGIPTLCPEFNKQKKRTNRPTGSLARGLWLLSLFTEEQSDFSLSELATRSLPEILRVDNGPEFLSSESVAWAESVGMGIHYIQRSPIRMRISSASTALTGMGCWTCTCSTACRRFAKSPTGG